MMVRLSSYFLQRAEQPVASSLGGPEFQQAFPVASGTIWRWERAAAVATRGPAVGEQKWGSSRQSWAFWAKPKTACSASAVNPAGRRWGYSHSRPLER